jgi:LAS superfamily LD-carboxypeptidase LdcB
MCLRKFIKVIAIFIAATTMCSCTFRSEATIADETKEPIIVPTEVSTGTIPVEPPTGWFSDENGKYYITEENGEKITGFYEIEGETYYFLESGYLHTGWLEEDEKKYYFQEDGAMAKGIISIDDNDYHFASNGEYVVVVNPWNYVPEDYDTNLVKLSSEIATTGSYGNADCVKDLEAMITDANKYSGARVYVVSAYRNVDLQTSNFNNKVRYYQNQGYSYDSAYTKAAQIIAVPGTSEHHLGLAFDIIDTRDWSLEERQENYAGQKWLMEHCHEYGFILRYPKNKTDVTGIIYEPWHYRYVGKELAMELYETGLTLEEYFSSLN